LNLPLLQVNNVSLDYEDTSGNTKCRITVVQQISFSLAQSERCMLLGASGSGKSTLLKAIGGYIKPAHGDIILDGKPILGPGPDRVMLFQEFDQLLPWRTVLGNVIFALEVSGKARGSQAQDKARAAISKVKLERVAENYPHQLSGGMKQRVALARALAMEPQILLMDEPFAALDALTRTQMQEELLQLWESLRLTLIFVTHSIREALTLGSRILILSPHPGRLQADIESAPTKETMIHDILFGDHSSEVNSDDR
jgi:NitT/TauT family transport system ATP-binding protein